MSSLKITIVSCMLSLASQLACLFYLNYMCVEGLGFDSHTGHIENRVAIDLPPLQCFFMCCPCAKPVNRGNGP